MHAIDIRIRDAASRRFQLALARDLARIYSGAVEEPMPANLQRLIALLERRGG